MITIKDIEQDLINRGYKKSVDGETVSIIHSKGDVLLYTTIGIKGLIYFKLIVAGVDTMNGSTNDQTKVDELYNYFKLHHRKDTINKIMDV